MAELLESRTLSISIAAPPAAVYEFAADPGKLPRWAAGLGTSVSPAGGDEWTVESPQGTLRLRFVARNALGVLDHRVTTPSGAEVYVPMRVVANGDGSEVLLTLFRTPEMSDADFERDAGLVQRDLASLRSEVERATRAGTR